MKTCVIEFRLYSFLPAVQNFGQIQHGECCPGNGIRRAQYFSPPLPPHHHHGRWLRREERDRRPINNNNNNAQWFSTTHSEQWEFEPTINFSRTEVHVLLCWFRFCFRLWINGNALDSDGYSQWDVESESDPTISRLFTHIYLQIHF